MHAAFLLGIAIVMVLVVADWVAFTRKTSSALRYGMTVGRHQETVRLRPDGFKPDGTLALSHGDARFYPEDRAIMLHADPQRFGFSFRSAWPINGTVYYTDSAEQPAVTLHKRMPWSSVILTVLWFLTVAVGILAYVVSYAKAGGFASVSGAFLAAALSGLGVMVLVFGMLIVVVAYRLEDKRMMAVYDELRSALSDG
jgi:hypothetical protein